MMIKASLAQFTRIPEMTRMQKRSIKLVTTCWVNNWKSMTSTRSVGVSGFTKVGLNVIDRLFMC